MTCPSSLSTTRRSLNCMNRASQSSPSRSTPLHRRLRTCSKEGFEAAKQPLRHRRPSLQRHSARLRPTGLNRSEPTFNASSSSVRSDPRLTAIPSCTPIWRLMSFFAHTDIVRYRRYPWNLGGDSRSLGDFIAVGYGAIQGDHTTSRQNSYVIDIEPGFLQSFANIPGKFPVLLRLRHRVSRGRGCLSTSDRCNHDGSGGNSRCSKDTDCTDKH